MAVTLSEPDAAKAATTAPDGGLLHFSIPIDKSKTRDTKSINPVDGTPDIEISGKCTDGTLDSDLQIVDPEASLRWIKAWDPVGNIRMQHDAKKPVGKGFQVDGHYISATIADPLAKHFVRTGVLNDFSIGIMNPDVRVGDPRFRHLDPMGKASNGVITDRADGTSGIGEISVVDRGSNYGTRFAIAKAAADGTPEWVGEMTAPDDVLARAAAVAKAARGPKTVTVELPKNMRVSVKPSDLAKLSTLRQRLATEQAQKASATAGGGEPAGPAMITKAALDAEQAVYKRDIDTATRRRLASEGHALPDGSYPIENQGDLHNAAVLARSGHGDVGAATALIGREARRLGVKNPMKPGKGKKGKKASKAAVPQAAKCTCDNGMMNGKPCPDCKKGRKAARRMVRKALAAPPVAKKKQKAVCGGCGAMQSRKHASCTECGKPMTSAMPVAKNHDHMCLGCGKTLDKGEKFCPGCGRENPGYLPVADHKIPMNAGKSAGPGKDRVTPDAGTTVKARKGKKGKPGKGKKKDGAEPFGGNQAMPFGSDGKDGKDKPKAEKRRKGGKTGKPTPGDGVTGEHTMPVPKHREPDSPAIERFEDDAGLQDGDEHQEMAAAMRHKALTAATGIGRDEMLLHDLTCPAFAPGAAAKALPYASFAGIDDAAWQVKAMHMAGSMPLDQLEKAGDVMALWQHAVTLKTTGSQILADVHADLHKAFRDANPGPATFPTPGHADPQQFRRPYIHEGHAAPSPMQGPPHSFAVPQGQPSAADFQRDLITAGHASDAPANNTPRHEPQPAPVTPGEPSRVYYQDTMRDNARQAMTAMHDHISRVFPDVCPMSPDMGETQKPAPEVPPGVGAPAPHRKSAKARKKAARKAAAVQAAKRRKVERRVMAGKISVRQARKALGLKAAPVKAARFPLAKAAKASPAVPLDAGLIKAAVTEATAPLLERVARQDKALRKQRKALDAIASQPDTSNAPYRGVARPDTPKSSAALAAPLNASTAAEQVQLADLQRLRWTSVNSPDPGLREAARRDLDLKLGLNPMTQT